MREVAERILFGTTLEEKLAPPPPGVVDDGRGDAIVVPETPSRPEGLELRSDGVRADFPGTAGIEDEEQRGRLLHFFANHELLATELMALVLLKFPEAPAEFRAGVLRTLKEEQMHTKLYLKRMAECGVEFGDLPVNGFFWKTVSSMTTPLDYVTRLSLTFEQANLDYARGYAKVFAESGDRETAAILERIYRDEIGHVSYGLKWFRRWKSEGSDWQEFVTGLHLPLSAARAKGAFPFNEEGRREAGFDEDFIRELRVCAQSKGRTPNVFWFNPGAEESLVTPGSVPTRAAGEMQRDLSLLPAYLARREDVVIVPVLPPTSFLTELLDAGIELPEIVAAERLPEIRERKLHELRPWARTPDAQPVIDSLGVECVPASRDLFSKALQAEFLRSLLENVTNPVLCGPEDVGTTVGSVDEVQDWMEASSFSQCVVKAPFSTAGRDRVICRVAEGVTDGVRVAVEELIGRQGPLVIEPWLERLVDFSVHYDMDDGGLRRRGLVVLENTERGQFRRAMVANRFTDFLEEEVRRVLFEGASRQGHLVEFMEDTLEPGLASLLEKHHYAGPVGVDSFLYRNQEGAVRWKPVVEINPRYTMGRVALELARFRSSQAGTSLTIAPVGKGPPGSLCLTPCLGQTRWAAYLGAE
ncbi:MAG: ferritin-like domain-containing protein [Roseibacillus sp.]|nr:ferritin-like domain-containing protein [Roseibacillus sp.]